MRQGDAVWGALLTAGLAYEVSSLVLDRDDDTLSRATRRWAHTHHPAGKALFIAGWSCFSVWWMKHVVSGGLS